MYRVVFLQGKVYVLELKKRESRKASPLIDYQAGNELEALQHLLSWCKNNLPVSAVKAVEIEINKRQIQ